MKRIALIAAAALVLLSGVGAGAYFYFKPTVQVATNPETPGLHSGQVASLDAAAKSDTDASKRVSGLIADLGRVQDRIIHGDREALSEQNRLLHEIGDILRHFEKQDWDTYANVRSAFVYVLSGGNYSVLQPVVDNADLYEVDRNLAQGIMLFAQGQGKAARGLFSNIDPRSLDVSLVGPFALARASLYIGQDEAKAVSLLDEARLASPHTAIEEAAARREISILVGTGENDRAMMLLADYVRRFGKSIYAWKLFRDFSEAAAKRNDLDGRSIVDGLVATTVTADQKVKAKLFLDMASEALLHGRLALAKAAADEVLKANPDAAEDLDKARLYEAAAQAPTANAADALKALQQITVDRLSDDDTAIHEVAGYIAHSVTGDELASRPEHAETAEHAGAANINGKNSGKTAPEVPRIAGAIANADAALQQADMVISGEHKMTESVGSAAQSQSMIEAVTQSASAKAGAHTHRANAKAAQETRQKDDDGHASETDQGAKGTPKNDDTSARSSVQKTDDSPRQSHRDSKKDDDKDKSFEATFDKLGPQSSSANAATANATQNALPNAIPAVWSAQVAFKQFTSSRLSDAKTADVAAVATNSKGASRPENLLKQESVAALLDAKNRLLSAQDTKDSVANNVSDTATASPVVVQARESHWIFGNDAAATLNQRVSDATSGNDKAIPLTAMSLAGASKAAGSMKAQDVAAKTPADATASPETPQVASTDGATARQTFDGQGGAETNGRDQTSGNAVERRVPDVPASKSAEHVSPDLADVTGGIAGPTQQIRNGVLDALSGGAKTTSTTPQLAQDSSAAAPGQVLRTIDITLSPENLGTVRVRLSLKSNSLEIDAEASKASTAKLLNDDRKDLEQSLRDAGYDVSSLKIADAASSSNAGLNSSLNGGGSAFQDGSQARANFAGRQDGNMQGRNGASPDQSQQQQSRNNNPKGSPGPELTNARRSNEIYI